MVPKHHLIVRIQKYILLCHIIATDDSRVQHLETYHTPCHSRGTKDPSISWLFFFDFSVTYLTVLSIKGILQSYRPLQITIFKSGYHILNVEQEATSRKPVIISERDKPESYKPKIPPTRCRSKQ